MDRFQVLSEALELDNSRTVAGFGYKSYLKDQEPTAECEAHSRRFVVEPQARQPSLRNHFTPVQINLKNINARRDKIFLRIPINL